MRNERSSNKVERNHRFFILSGNLELLVSSRSLVDLKQFYIVTFVLKIIFLVLIILGLHLVWRLSFPKIALVSKLMLIGCCI